MNMQSLLAGAAANLPREVCDMPVNGLALDSRLLARGHVFIALNGSRNHGLAHLRQAIDNGASAVIYDPAGDGARLAEEACASVPMIAVGNLGTVLGEIAARFYGNPSQSMAVIGITGTNGKTSCSQFLSQMLEACGIIGTLGWGEWGRLHKTVNTTPDALSVQSMLASLLKDNKQAVAMEVSSHGLEQGRVNGVNFHGAVFTNFSRDHLDYHGTMEAYLAAKLILLAKPGLSFAVVNLDDAYSDRIIAAAPDPTVIWGVSVNGKTHAEGETVGAENCRHSADGMAFDVCWRARRENAAVPLYGDFNIENVLLVLAVMLALGVEFSAAVKKLALLKPIPGRMERFGGDGMPLVFVDYAHTPDALDKALASARKHCRKALWVVFGCGGDRDAGKRPLMGACAEQWADHLIVTDDNPRFEESASIIAGILAGCRSTGIEVIQDRLQAIRHAIEKAADDDCIVLAGKGHEDYQDIKGVQTPFNDRQVVVDALKKRALLTCE